MEILYVTAAIIHNNDKILIAQRSYPGKFAGLWEFPGGKPETGEDFSSCIAREITEELGVEIKIEKEFLMVEHDYRPEGKLTHLHSFLCTIINGEPKPLEHLSLQWVDVDELLKFEFVPADIPIVKKLQKNKNV